MNTCGKQLAQARLAVVSFVEELARAEDSYERVKQKAATLIEIETMKKDKKKEATDDKWEVINVKKKPVEDEDLDELI